MRAIGIAKLSPFDANRYAYSGGDPINNTDPGGLKSCAKALFEFSGDLTLVSVGLAGLIISAYVTDGLDAALVIDGSLYLVHLLIAAYNTKEVAEACG